MNVVIIGNGIAGISAARQIRKLSDHSITVISGESDHFFSRTALMYVYMGHMEYKHIKPYEDWFWEKNNIKLKKAWVHHIDFEKQLLQFENGENMAFDKLLLATGSKLREMSVPGIEAGGVQGLYSLQDLEKMEATAAGVKQAVIVGGGLIGIEMAEMLHSRGVEVTIVIRESHYWGNVLPANEGNLIAKHIAANHISLIKDDELAEVLKDADGNVKAIRTKNGKEINCQFLGISVGVVPNIEFLKNATLETSKGIYVNEYLETNVPNVYAVGDCIEHRNVPEGRVAIEQVWYTGRIMGETVAHTICGKKRAYRPGVWFNSAKFFDIEYQVYGLVPNELVAGLAQFYWEDAKSPRAVRVVWDNNTNIFLGIHSFGVRLRHEVCEEWIQNKFTVEKALSELNRAAFDAEFTKQWIPLFVEEFRKEHPGFEIKQAQKGLFARIFG